MYAQEGLSAKSPFDGDLANWERQQQIAKIWEGMTVFFSVVIFLTLTVYLALKVYHTVTIESELCPTCLFGKRPPGQECSKILKFFTAEQADDLVTRINPRLVFVDLANTEVPQRSMFVITLRYLITGETVQNLAASTGIPALTIMRFIPRICYALYLSLREKYLKAPFSYDEWRAIGGAFGSKLGFPMCLGVLDGRYVRPIGSQTIINILVLVDAEMRFRAAELDPIMALTEKGEIVEGHVWKTMKYALLVHPKYETDEGDLIPNVFLSHTRLFDSPNVLNSYSLSNLNVNLVKYNMLFTRSTNVSEKAFGLLTRRFGAINRVMEVDAEDIHPVLFCCFALHNYLLKNNYQYYVGKRNNSLLSNLPRWSSNVFHENPNGLIVREKIMRHITKSNLPGVCTS